MMQESCPNSPTHLVNPPEVDAPSPSPAAPVYLIRSYSGFWPARMATGAPTPPARMPVCTPPIPGWCPARIGLAEREYSVYSVGCHFGEGCKSEVFGWSDKIKASSRCDHCAAKGVQRVPSPGSLDSASREEDHPDNGSSEGHTCRGQTAFFIIIDIVRAVSLSVGMSHLFERRAPGGRGSFAGRPP